MRDDLRPERADFRAEKADLRAEGANLRPERADLRPRMAGGGTDDGETEKRRKGEAEKRRNKIALCGIIGHRPLRGR